MSKIIAAPNMQEDIESQVIPSVVSNKQSDLEGSINPKQSTALNTLRRTLFRMPTSQHLEIDANESFEAAGTSRTVNTQRLKLYNMPTLSQKVQLWLIVLLSSGSLLSNLCSFASSLGLLSFTNSSTPCAPWRPPTL